jgi:outer membrane biosynthesis protein TonB
MASTERIFFAGVATTVLLIGAGFSGGVMLGKTAMDIPQAKEQAVASPEKLPPPARVVLPAVTEASVPIPFVPESASHIQATAPTVQEPQSKPMPEPAVLPSKVVPAQKQDIEKERPAEHQAEARKHSEQRKNAERERHRRHAERKARAARQEHQEQQQQEEDKQRESPGILAFDGGDEPLRQSGFFGD